MPTSTDYADGAVFRVDTLTLRPTALDIGGPVASIVVDDDNGLLWLAIAEPYSEH